MNGLSVKRPFSAVSDNDSSEHRPSKLVKRAPNATNTVERNWGSWFGSAVQSFKGLFSSPGPTQPPMRSISPLASHPRGALGWIHSGGHQVFEVPDDGEDSGTEALAIRQKRDRGTLEARQHLNDHAARHTGIHHNPGQIHPNLEQPLFSSKYSPNFLPPSEHVNVRSSSTNSSSSAAGPSSGPSTPPRASTRPDVAYKKPSRSYSWKRQDDGSASPTTHEAYTRGPKQLSRPSKSSANLRTGRNDSGQEKMLQRHYVEAVNAGDHGTAMSLARVREAYEQDRSKERRDAARPFAARVGLSPDLRKEGDLSLSLHNLKLDVDKRRLLDDKLQGPREPRAVPKPIRNKRRPVPTSLDVQKTHVYDRLRREDQEAERQVKERLQPRIPDDVTPQQAAIIRDRFSDRSFAATLGSAELSSSSLQRLKPDVWLNDEVINFYVELINTRAKDDGRPLHCLNTFFYEKLSVAGYAGAKLARWTKRMKLDIFALDKLLIPINHGNSHWVCAVINFKQRRIEYYDSLADSGRRYEVFKTLRGYLQSEHQEKKGSSFDLRKWEDQFDPDTPKQNNYTDCGVFACQTLESTARGRDLVKQKFEFDGDNMAFFRRLMVVEIASGALGARPWGT
ncbi:Sentrin-specific protease [Vanrija pseudolonga]|uniref:Sentrin-specific protease n=1 Tax=Vanrija pseudolonga TaxID=143232 RepID=A0AAF1BPQ3_9TREE|nr:Sentrin-specific protease [Vanrija pseudolonga]